MNDQPADIPPEIKIPGEVEVWWVSSTDEPTQVAREIAAVTDLTEADVDWLLDKTWFVSENVKTVRWRIARLVAGLAEWLERLAWRINP